MEELSQQLALLNQNDKLLDELYRHYAAGVNLSATALWILYIAWIQGDGCTQKDICEAWSYTKQTINSALKNLEKQGYIRLVPLPGNRKSKRLLFTDAGRAFAQSVVCPLLAAEEAAFGRLEKEERIALVALSQKRTALLQQEMEKAMTAMNTGQKENPHEF